MKKLTFACVCIFAVIMLVSCDNVKNNSNTTTTVKADANIPTSSNDSTNEQINEDLISRIESLEKEIASLKEILLVKAESPNSHGTVFNALVNDRNEDNIYLGMDKDGEYVTAIYIKKPIFNSYKFYILLGYETDDNVPILNSLIKPHYMGNSDDKLKEYGVDKDKFEVAQLLISRLKYDETSSMLIIMIDNNGKEYSDYVPSIRFMMDI